MIFRIQSCEGVVVDGDYPDLHAAAAAHPATHSIWRKCATKANLGVRYNGYWHRGCWRRYQKSHEPKKWPTAEAYLVSGAETLLENQTCRGCARPILKKP